MCGINGIIGLSDNILAAEKVKAMNTALAHRGPDDEGVFSDGAVALGHRRLSIIDLSAAGKQPMSSANGQYMITYNGELYNYVELKNKLPDYPYKTNTDTEVILAAYQKWGVNCVEYFQGMFAFALWDKSSKELFIARDRLGIKPLYYHVDKNKVLVFSSELRALLASDIIARKINHNAIADYFQYQTVHAPETIIENVKMLMPGCCYVIRSNEHKIFSYWNLNEKYNPEIKSYSYNKICADINLLLTQAVEKRLVSDVPFGAFLSGGIDSSAIAALMSKVMTSKPETFSVIFDEQEFSEAKYAKLVSEKFNTQHHEIKLKVSDFVNQLPIIMDALDFPGGDGPNTYMVSKATKNAGITMALSGLGGDELFAGYDVFKRLYKLNKFSAFVHLPSVFKKTLAGLLSSRMGKFEGEKLKVLSTLNNFDVDTAYYLSRLMMTNDKLNKLYNGKLPVLNFVQNVFNKTNFPFDKDFLLSKVSYAEINTYLQNVLLRDTDQMSMAHSLEVRVPFLDHHLLEYVYSVPDKYKFPHTPKKLLVDSLSNLLPPEIINRPKMGFTLPWNAWLRNELKEFCEKNIHSLCSRSFINSDEMMNLWRLFLKNDTSVKWSHLWYLIVLEHWLTKNNIES